MVGERRPWAGGKPRMNAVASRMCGSPSHRRKAAGARGRRGLDTPAGIARPRACSADMPRSARRDRPRERDGCRSSRRQPGSQPHRNRHLAQVRVVDFVHGEMLESQSRRRIWDMNRDGADNRARRPAAFRLRPLGQERVVEHVEQSARSVPWCLRSRLRAGLSCLVVVVAFQAGQSAKRGKVLTEGASGDEGWDVASWNSGW